MRIFFLLVVCFLFTHSAYAAFNPKFYKNMTYSEAKKEFTLFMKSNPSNDEILKVYKKMVRSSEFGNRGLNNVYKNFEGGFKIDPNTPGLNKLFLMMFSSNSAQRKGYRRELLTFQHLSNDHRFGEFKIGERLDRKWGSTDADISFTHNKTGARVRIEVKDYSISSQKTNISNLKAQIDKMSIESKKYGTRQVWMNHNEVLPELREYAESNGIKVYENVKTGSKSGGLNIADVRDMLDDDLNNRGAGLPLKQSGKFKFPSKLISIKNRVPRSIFSPKLFGRLAGGGYAVYQSAIIANSAYQLASGRVTKTVFVSRSIQGTAGLVGSIGGAEIGAVMGSVVPVAGTAIGGVIGAIVGGAIGHYAGSALSDSYLNNISNAQSEALGEFIYAQYGIKDGN